MDSIPKAVEHGFKGVRAVMVIIVSVIIIYVAILFITAFGDPGKIQHAKETLRISAIGIGVLLIAYILGAGIDAVIQCIVHGVCL